MMEQRDNSGAIFKAKASDNPNWPTHEGKCMIGGQEFYISAWVKEGANGKFFSLAFKTKTATAAKPASKPAPVDSDDIPF